MNEIKKCPYCGGEPTFEQVHSCTGKYPTNTDIQIIYSMKCETCGYEFGREATLITVFNDGEIKVYEDGYKKLVSKWNKRVEEPRKESRVEQILKRTRFPNKPFCNLAYNEKYGKGCKDLDCCECEFHDLTKTARYLLAPHEEDNHD